MSTPNSTSASPTVAPAAGDPRRATIELELPIEGMTCASCVARIERFLKHAPGVEDATVNLATERATIVLDPAVAGRDEAVEAIRSAGYDVRDVPAPGPEAAAGDLVAAVWARTPSVTGPNARR